MSDPTKTCADVGLNEWRMKVIRLDHGAADENSDDSVPAHRREAFNAKVQFDREFAADWFERNCKHFGGTGAWATVPKAKRHKALRYFARKNAEWLNVCQYEYDLLKIEQEEELEAAFDRDIG